MTNARFFFQDSLASAKSLKLHRNMVETILASLVTGLVGLFVGNRLSLGKDTVNRKREFRNSIRTIPLRFDGVHPMNFVKTYSETLPIVREACAKIQEDISFWNRRKFENSRNRYCGFKQADLELPRPNTPAGLQEYLQQNQEKRQEVTAELKKLLESIARSAG